MASDREREHHHHQHRRESEDSHDPGALYSQEWVQDLVRKIQGFIRTNVVWLGLTSSESQRVLDYACGHGTVSLALAGECPNAVFQGVDAHSKQVARYNDEAHKLFGEDNNRMCAIRGDLSDPSPDLDAADWSNFDVAIISMALHHVPEPVEMLSQLRKRLKRGGALTVVEWYEDADSENLTGSDKLDRNDMITAHGGEKIWAGFTPRGLGEMLKKAGFTEVDVKLPDLSFHIPEHDRSGDDRLLGHDKKLMFVKGLNGEAGVE